MEQKLLADELKAGKLRPVYLLYGAERYLVLHYARAIEKAAGTAREAMHEGASAAEIIMACDSVPFFAQQRRLIYVNDSGLLAAGRKDDAEKIAAYIEKIPADTTLVFVETEVDKRTRLYKTLKDSALECTTPEPQTLAKWITREVRSHGKAISPREIHQLTATCGTDMSNLHGEIHKLCSYAAGDITADDILSICSPTTEARIFELVKCMATGRTADALRRYADMLALRESPMMVLAMIIRQLRLMCQAQAGTAAGMSPAAIASRIGSRDFIVREAASQARRYSGGKLLQALRLCQDTDMKIKTGLASQETGVEMLLLRVARLGG
jgi:DNA polymerase-3 subunit delta